MQRPLFDPTKMAKAPMPTAGMTSAAPWSVTQLAEKIAGALQQGFPTSVRVAGEISGFRDRTHWYFDLKDDGAVVNCVAFASVAKKLGFTPATGEQVVVVGRPDFYAPGGKVSLIVESIERAGLGALDVALKKLVEDVRALGWMDPARKREVPLLPRRVAVVTSRTGAALQDVLVTMRGRCPCVDVLIVDVRVQGEGSAADVTGAVRDLSRTASSLGVDAILITRGGGSMEDLWAFNDKELARAIVESLVPVVAAIGHETDTTIAELVADVRCATPTQAAMRLTPDRNALLRQTDAEATRLRMLVQRTIREARARLGLAERASMFRDPRALLEPHERTMQESSARLMASLQGRVMVARARVAATAMDVERTRPAAVLARGHERARASMLALDRAVRGLWALESQRLDALHRQLHAVSPQSVLERGFSVTLTPGGAAVRSSQDVTPGQLLHTRLADGSIASVVQGEGGLSPLPVASPGPGMGRRKSRGVRGSQDRGPGLFE
jgi:exodeoxyribonuclease VII large subunit